MNYIFNDSNRISRRSIGSGHLSLARKLCPNFFFSQLIKYIKLSLDYLRNQSKKLTVWELYPGLDRGLRGGHLLCGWPLAGGGYLLMTNSTALLENHSRLSTLSLSLNSAFVHIHYLIGIWFCDQHLLSTAASLEIYIHRKNALNMVAGLAASQHGIIVSTLSRIHLAGTE
jgi:hypothetical protein